MRSPDTQAVARSSETSSRRLALLHQGTAVAAGLELLRGGFSAALLPPVPDEDQQPEEVDVDQHNHDVAHRLVLQRDRIPAAGGLGLQDAAAAIDRVLAIPAE